MRRLLTLAVAALVGVPVLTLGPGAHGLGGPPRPTPATDSAGYHHLGATSREPQYGVLGRIAVTDPAVRGGTYDFVAARFMAKRDHDGRTDWLEAGWAETGWAGGGRQRVYTFDTVHNEWTFYDQYPLHPGDRIWIYLITTDTSTKPTWRAWLWWGDAWHLLTSVGLPLAGGAQVEQYVEVYVDPGRAGTLAVPAIATDNVQLKRSPGEGGEVRYWRDAEVPTDAGTGDERYCLAWRVAFDTWSAGDCPV
jgi:hypothetical protein